MAWLQEVPRGMPELLYETGQQTIPLDMLCALALLYGVSVDYLLGLTDERRPYPRK